jgi:hypothetical protein
MGINLLSYLLVFLHVYMHLVSILSVASCYGRASWTDAFKTCCTKCNYVWQELVLLCAVIAMRHLCVVTPAFSETGMHEPKGMPV